MENEKIVVSRRVAQLTVECAAAAVSAILIRHGFIAKEDFEKIVAEIMKVQLEDPTHWFSKSPEEQSGQS